MYMYMYMYMYMVFTTDRFFEVAIENWLFVYIFLVDKDVNKEAA